MRIGAVSLKTGMRASAIRFYESVGVLPAPARLDSGYRDYSHEDEVRIRFLERIRRLGLSIDELRVLIRFREHPHGSGGVAADVFRRAIEEIELQVQVLEQISQVVSNSESAFPQ